MFNVSTYKRYARHLTIYVFLKETYMSRVLISPSFTTTMLVRYLSLNFHNINDNHLQSGIIYMTCTESKHVIRNIKNFFINNFYFKIFPAVLLHMSDFGIRLSKYKTCHHASLLLKTCILCLDYV